MSDPVKTKILKLDSAKCTGCLECEKACSNVHFQVFDGGDKSAIRIYQKTDTYEMSVCNQCGLCIDLCQVGALTRMPNGVVILNKNPCIGCEACVGFCPTGAMRKAAVRIEPFKCFSCGACVQACPEDALELVEVDISDVKKIVYNDYEK